MFIELHKTNDDIFLINTSYIDYIMPSKDKSKVGIYCKGNPVVEIKESYEEIKEMLIPKPINVLDTSITGNAIAYWGGKKNNY